MDKHVLAFQHSSFTHQKSLRIYDSKTPFSVETKLITTTTKRSKILVKINLLQKTQENREKYDRVLTGGKSNRRNPAYLRLWRSSAQNVGCIGACCWSINVDRVAEYLPIPHVNWRLSEIYEN
jgi:hypothetical protein